MIGRGVFSVDDHLKFGKFIDELSRFTYTIMYVVKRDTVIACLPKDRCRDLTRKFGGNIVRTVVPKKGKLAFVELRWR